MLSRFTIWCKAMRRKRHFHSPVVDGNPDATMGLSIFAKQLILPPCRKGPLVSRTDFRMGLRQGACSRQARTTSPWPSMVQRAQALLSRCSIPAFNTLARAALFNSNVEINRRLKYPARYPSRCVQPDSRCSSNHHSALDSTKLEFPNQTSG